MIRSMIGGKRIPEPQPNETMPVVSIITPVYNIERYFEECVLSVITQSYENIEIIVIDGGSTDGTLDIIRKYEDRIAYWVSEPDDGLYSAVNKGFDRATGEIITWIGGDDKYHPGAIEQIVNIFRTYDHVQWVTGISTFYDENGVTNRIGVPMYYSKKGLRMGLYNGEILPNIQEESTFWRRSLLEKAGPLNERLKLAADYELWIRFSEHARLYQIPTIIGGFRRRSGQVSGDTQGYLRECESVRRIRFPKLWHGFGKMLLFVGIMKGMLEMWRKKEVF